MRVHLLSLFAVVQAGPLADKWAGFVTSAYSSRSVWSNKDQLAREATEPNLPADHKHPNALQTRFPMDKHVSGGNGSERFVAIEMGGGKPDCLPDCDVVLFGLSDKDASSVLLKSYKSDKLKAAVKAVQDNPQHVGAVIDKADLEFHGYTVTYQWFPSNSSFYGVGGGKLDDGSHLDVYETIAHGLVAPLELFYDSSGAVLTPYVTPIEYHPDSMVEIVV